MRKTIIAYMRDDEIIDELATKHDVIRFLNNEYLGDEAFTKALAKADGIIGLNLAVTKELLDCTPNLKIVSNTSVGYDNLHIEEMTKRKIMATNTPGVLDDTTADLVIALMLAAARRVTELDHYVKSGQWDKVLQPHQYGVDVHHKTLGIIGMGNIGTAIAKRARFGFNMEILYYNRRRNLEAEKLVEATYCNLDELLMRSDFVCLMVPATTETRKMIGKEELKKMKKTAIFINASRGQNVDENALYEALRNGDIYAAGIDVFEKEPTDKNNPLLTLKNIVTLPHIGSSTIECEQNITKLAVENLLAGLEGRKPPNLINEEVWNE